MAAVVPADEVRQQRAKETKNDTTLELAALLHEVGDDWQIAASHLLDQRCKLQPVCHTLLRLYGLKMKWESAWVLISSRRAAYMVQEVILRQLALADSQQSLHCTMQHMEQTAVCCFVLQKGKEGVQEQYEQTDDFHEKWKMKARDLLAKSEWRRRKLVKRVRGAAGVFSSSSRDSQQQQLQQLQVSIVLQAVWQMQLLLLLACVVCCAG